MSKIKHIFAALKYYFVAAQQTSTAKLPVFLLKLNKQTVAVRCSGVSNNLVGPCYTGPKFRYFCDKVLKGRVLSICECLTVNLCKITQIKAGVNWGPGNKDQEGSLCRSFSRCNHALAIISEIMHIIFSQVTCFLFSTRIGVLRADFHSSISDNRLHFCNLYFVMVNFYSFGSDHSFLFDQF